MVYHAEVNCRNCGTKYRIEVKEEGMNVMTLTIEVPTYEERYVTKDGFSCTCEGCENTIVPRLKISVRKGYPNPILRITSFTKIG